MIVSKNDEQCCIAKLGDFAHVSAPWISYYIVLHIQTEFYELHILAANNTKRYV